MVQKSAAGLRSETQPDAVDLTPVHQNFTLSEACRLASFSPCSGFARRMMLYPLKNGDRVVSLLFKRGLIYIIALNTAIMNNAR